MWSSHFSKKHVEFGHSNAILGFNSSKVIAVKKFDLADKCVNNIWMFLDLARQSSSVRIPQKNHPNTLELGTYQHHRFSPNTNAR